MRHVPRGLNVRLRRRWTFLLAGLVGLAPSATPAQDPEPAPAAPVLSEAQLQALHTLLRTLEALRSDPEAARAAAAWFKAESQKAQADLKALADQIREFESRLTEAQRRQNELGERLRLLRSGSELLGLALGEPPPGGLPTPPAEQAPPAAPAAAASAPVAAPAGDGSTPSGTKPPARVSPRGLELFKKQIAIIFEDSCSTCHNPNRKRGGLDLTTREAMLQGSEGGPVVIPGKAEESRLYQAVARTREPFMPYEEPPLSAEAVRAIAEWINEGAPYDEPVGPTSQAPRQRSDQFQVTQADRNFWAFRPLDRVEPPVVPEGPWATHPIDRFLRARQIEAGLEPTPPIDRRRLIRRLSFDLLGLPPTPEQIQAFVEDPSPRAYERLIDDLLASPHFGERWARHWLDLARYADSGGYEFDFDRPAAYPYRDFVIRALNEDMPFDQFLRWQLAGDEFARQDSLALAATGFLAAGPTVGNQETELNRYDELDDMLSTTASAFLGLTVGCARCHDHKYDPIPQRDYYRLLAAFTTTERHEAYLADPAEVETYLRAKGEHDRESGRARNRLNRFLWELKRPFLAPRIEAFELDPESKDLLLGPLLVGNKRQGELLERFKVQLELPDDTLRANVDVEDRLAWAFLEAEVRRAEAAAPPAPPQALTVRDAKAEPAETFRLGRGDPANKLEPVRLGFLTVLTPPALLDAEPRQAWRPADLPEAPSTFQRAALAEWMTDPDRGAGHLVARVIVNRLWQHHFGDGLVRTPSDFGLQGDRPSHPQLLDWLAAELIAGGWRLKPIHRLMVLSQAYQQDSTYDEAKARIDPDDRLLWRRAPRRIEAEVLRDAILVVSGLLNPQMYGPGVRPRIHPDALATGSTYKWPTDVLDGPATYRRSVYVYVKRSVRLPLMESFDAADPAAPCARRTATTVPAQALTLMNSEFINDQARAFARRLEADCGESAPQRIERAFALALGRPPEPWERTASLAFLDRQQELQARRSATAGGTTDEDPRRLAWVDFCQAMLSLNEFIYVD